ncbi:sarcosine oxidase subunit beta [Allostella vacuolata]|nr:sarcosine oxidase subunit beta [Stella vacuolata]
MTVEADVVIVGGGLHGCSAALHLAQRGQRVVLLERRHVGRHSSGINAGGVRTMNRDPAEIGLSVAGMELWRRIGELVGDDCGFHAHGQIRVAETDAELAKVADRVAMVRGLGFRHEELIERDELRRLVPAIAPHCVGGLIVRDDGAADPYRTTLAFGRRAAALGADIREGEGLVALERAGADWLAVGEQGRYRAPVVVNAAGAWAGDVAAMVGDRFDLRVRASMMMVTERVPHFLDPVIAAVGRALSFKQSDAGTVVIGGGQQGVADRHTETTRIAFANLARSAVAATALFPAMRGVRLVRSWCGIEAETPDHLPVLGRSVAAEGVIHSFGYSGHGFQLGPICGAVVADLVTRGGTNLPISGLAPGRFGERFAGRP